MNDEATIAALIVRGILALGLVAGGLVCLFSAPRIAFSKEGPKRDPARFSGKIGPFEFHIASGTLGVLVFCVSAVWAGLGYLAAPSSALEGKG